MGSIRTADYLADAGINCREFTFSEGSATRRPMTAIRTSRRDDVRTIEWLIGWPENPTLDWRKGFLAGIFDAEGSYSGSLRIPNTDPEIISWTVSSLESLGFDYVMEPRNLPMESSTSGCAAGCGKRCGSSTPSIRRSPGSGRSRGWR